MIHRESGVLKTSYQADMALYPLPIARWSIGGARWCSSFLVVPLAAAPSTTCRSSTWSRIAIIGALGLNILVGYTGQVSIGHGAFMSVGAYTAANLAIRLGARRAGSRCRWAG